MIHLVEHVDVVRDLLPAQEAVHVGHKDQELLKALPEGHQHCQAVRPPGSILFPVLRGRLWRASPRWAPGLLPLSPGHLGHISRAAELQPEQGEEDQQEEGNEEVEDGAFPAEASRKQPGPGIRAAGRSGGQASRDPFKTISLASSGPNPGLP